MTGRESLEVSLVIPVFNEEDNVVPLAREIAAALRPRCRFEAIFVDDGSTDRTAAGLAAELPAMTELRLLRHAARSGKSAAIRSGVRAARAPWIVTLDGDRQNDPADIPRLLDIAWGGTRPGGGGAEGGAAPLGPSGSVLVAGWRVGRRDTLSRRLASRFANRLRRTLLRDGCPDTACSLKVFRREDFLALPFFDSMHRFLPALFRLYGHAVINEPVNDRPRLSGRTKYTNLGRALVGLPDLLGMVWLVRRTTVPPMVTEAAAADPIASPAGPPAGRDRATAG